MPHDQYVYFFSIIIICMPLVLRLILYIMPYPIISYVQIIPLISLGILWNNSVIYRYIHLFSIANLEFGLIFTKSLIVNSFLIYILNFDKKTDRYVSLFFTLIFIHSNNLITLIIGYFAAQYFIPQTLQQSEAPKQSELKSLPQSDLKSLPQSSAQIQTLTHAKIKAFLGFKHVRSFLNFKDFNINNVDHFMKYIGNICLILSFILTYNIQRDFSIFTCWYHDNVQIEVKIAIALLYTSLAIKFSLVTLRMLYDLLTKKKHFNSSYFDIVDLIFIFQLINMIQLPDYKYISQNMFIISNIFITFYHISYLITSTKYSVWSIICDAIRQSIWCNILYLIVTMLIRYSFY